MKQGTDEMNTRIEPFRAGLAILTAVAMVAAMILLFGSAPALGQSSEPSTECASELWNEEYWKVQYNDNTDTFGTIQSSSVGNGAITLNADGSWTNNTSYDVFRIVLKVGSGVGDDVVHEPPVNPIDLTIQGLSHITFCFTDPILELDLVKEWTGDEFDDSELSVQLLIDGKGGPVEVEDGETVDISESVTGLPENCTYESDAPETYTVDEDDAVNGLITLTITNTVDCEEEPEPETGTIVVAKQVAEGDSQDVAFTFNATGFTLSDNTLAHNESGSAGVAAGGDYSVSETVLAGWELVSATCDSTDEADDSTPADINVSDGETVTCTFLNQIVDDVAGTTITTSTSTTAPAVQVTTTIADEVLDTHVEAEELPFTGIDSELLVGMAVIMLMSGLLVLGVTGRREDA